MKDDPLRENLLLDLRRPSSRGGGVQEDRVADSGTPSEPFGSSES